MASDPLPVVAAFHVAEARPSAFEGARSTDHSFAVTYCPALRSSEVL